jgi:hypothetical protein
MYYEKHLTPFLLARVVEHLLDTTVTRLAQDLVN